MGHAYFLDIVRTRHRLAPAGHFVRAMHEHLHQHPPALPQGVNEERLLQVLVDQLSRASRVGSYLPTSSDPLLARLLQLLENAPGDPHTLAELAHACNSTERTMMRRCQRELGTSFAQWRQRLRVVAAMTLLEQGNTVESIAFELGYASASAFITMFRRVTGMTPDACRRQG